MKLDSDRTYVLFSESREFTRQCVAFAQSGVSCSGTHLFFPLQENKPMVTKGERVGGIHWEVGIGIYTLSYIK